MSRSFLLLTTLLSLSTLFLSASAVCNSPQLTCPTGLDEVPSPFYALTFDQNPAAAVGSPTNYQWLASDASETCPYVHQGVVNLGAASGNGGVSDGTGLGYIDLNVTLGPQSAGAAVTTLGKNIGGASSGSIGAGTSGWSFEFTAKAFSSTGYAKFYCMGQGAGEYDILEGFVGTSQEIDHTIDLANGDSYNRVVLPNQPGLPFNTCQPSSSRNNSMLRQAARSRQPQCDLCSHSLSVCMLLVAC